MRGTSSSLCQCVRHTVCGERLPRSVTVLDTRYAGNVFLALSRVLDTQCGERLPRSPCVRHTCVRGTSSSLCHTRVSGNTVTERGRRSPHTSSSLCHCVRHGVRGTSSSLCQCVRHTVCGERLPRSVTVRYTVCGERLPRSVTVLDTRCAGNVFLALSLCLDTVCAGNVFLARHRVLTQ